MKILELLLCSITVLPTSVSAPELATTTHDHAAHASRHDEVLSTANQPAWRYVLHYGCGTTAVYLVDVPAVNTLLCPGCGFLFTCFVR